MTGYPEIQVLTETEGTVHLHREPEALYVVKGRAQIAAQEENYMLKEKDIMIVNSEESHAVRVFSESLVLSVKLDFFFLEQMYPGKKVLFFCNSVSAPEVDYGRLLYLLDQMTENYVNDGRELLTKSLYYAFWQFLCDRFMKEERQIKGDEKLSEILKEIQERYGTVISLSEMAAKQYMSESSFSRYFKKYMGINFGEYVLKIRLEHAEKELLFTDKTITQISYNCGFSSSSVFNKTFKKRHGVSPGEYRLAKAGDKSAQGGNRKKELLRQYLNLGNEEILSKKPQNQYFIDADKGRMFSDNILVCINAGHASSLLEGRVQEHVSRVVKKLHIRYIRILDPFGENMEIQMKGVNEDPNFDKLDRVLDFLISINVLPVIEFPENRKKIIAHFGSVVGSQEERNDTFSSMEEWLKFLEDFLMHLAERYTAQAVNSWCVEIWETPEVEMFSENSYLSFYEATRCKIKEYFPRMRIGACGLSPDISREKLKSYLRYWKTSGTSPDYLSALCYPYTVDYYGKGNRLLKLATDSRFMKEKTEQYKDLLQEIDYPDTPIWISEWNTSVSNRNIYNDSCAKACHMLTQMKDMLGEIQTLSYGNISDSTALYYDSRKPFVGASGLISKDGIPKPAYYAMEFWSVLSGGERLLGKGDNYILTACSDGTLALLAFYPQKFHYGYFMKEEDEWKPEDIPFMFEEAEDLELEFCIRQIKNGQKKINRYSLCEDDGSVLSEWEKMGYESNLNHGEREYLQRACKPRLQVWRVAVTDWKLDLKIILKPGEMALFLIM